MPTRHGETHIIASGSPDTPPLMQPNAGHILEYDQLQAVSSRILKFIQK